MNAAIGNTDNCMKSFAGQCSKPVSFKHFQMFCRLLFAAVRLALVMNVVSTLRLWFMECEQETIPRGQGQAGFQVSGLTPSLLMQQGCERPPVLGSVRASQPGPRFTWLTGCEVGLGDVSPLQVPHGPS